MWGFNRLIWTVSLNFSKNRVMNMLNSESHAMALTSRVCGLVVFRYEISSSTLRDRLVIIKAVGTCDKGQSSRDKCLVISCFTGNSFLLKFITCGSNFISSLTFIFIYIRKNLVQKIKLNLLLKALKGATPVN